MIEHIKKSVMLFNAPIQRVYEANRGTIIRTIIYTIGHFIIAEAIFITLRKYHGKIYKFKKDQNDLIFVGSSNFSGTGMYGNLECNTSVLDRGSKDHISKFLNHLFTSKELCANLDNVELTIKKKRRKEVKKNYLSMKYLKHHFLNQKF